jgi:endonuclease/exonuclease/phosphatase family protein
LVKSINRILILAAFTMTNFIVTNVQAIEIPKKANNNLRIATFNVSMEALNYVPYQRGVAPKVTGQELSQALKENHPQIKNIAEIIQRVNPDIILLNEFDRNNNKHQALKSFMQNYLAKSQQDQQAITFPYFFQGAVNTGVKTPFDLNHNAIKGETPQDTYGFGYFPGHFGMALLSKYPIDEKNIRTFQLFKWQDMPNALQPIDTETKQPWYSKEAWQGFRLSSKSHWDIPIKVNGKLIHVLASHPTPPVFDGTEDRNGKRNHDEIRFWHDYITPKQGSYIYDDNNKLGSLDSSPFVILGDQNASNVEGDAIHAGISLLLNSPLIQDAKPKSLGAKEHAANNVNGQYHTAYWGMRADYILPSVNGWKITNSGVFWPTEEDQAFRLIKDRAASSDHRLVWLDLAFTH